MIPIYRLGFQSNSYVSNIQIMFPIFDVCFQYTIYVSKLNWCFQTAIFLLYVSNIHGADKIDSGSNDKLLAISGPGELWRQYGNCPFHWSPQHRNFQKHDASSIQFFRPDKACKRREAQITHMVCVVWDLESTKIEITLLKVNEIEIWKMCSLERFLQEWPYIQLH